MLRCLFVLFFSFFSLGGLYAGSQVFLTKNQVLLTNEGIFVDYNGSLAKANSLEFCGAIYIASIDSPQLAGQCCQCGSRIGPNGQCENQYCNNSGRNGPREKD